MEQYITKALIVIIIASAGADFIFKYDPRQKRQANF